MIEIVYYNIRGRVNPIITLCEFLKVDYKIKRVTGYNEWNTLKPGYIIKENFFINLPHIIHGEKVLSETSTIIYYIISNYGKNWLPKPEDMIDFLVLQGVISDIFESFVKLAFKFDEIEKLKEEYKILIESIKNKFDGINFILEKNEWLSGNKLSYLDFVFAEIIEIFLTFEKENNLSIISNHLSFSKYLERFVNIEEVKNFRNSDRFLKRPYLAPFLVWT